VGEQGPEGAAVERPSWRTRLARWAFDRPLRHIVVGAGSVLLVLTAPFGGWATARTDTVAVRQLAPGQRFTAGPLQVTLDRAVWNTDPSTSFSASEVGGYLMLVGTIRSTDAEMVAGDVMHGFVRLTGLTNLVKSPNDSPVEDDQGVVVKDVPTVPAEEATYSIYSVDDESLVSTVGYGLTYKVVLVFQAKGSQPPASVDVRTYGWTWRESRIDRQLLWLDRVQEGRLSLPVTVSTVHAHPEERP
jgi:hypothetical protein